MKTIPTFTIATLICSPALASGPQFAGSTLDFSNRSEISNADPNKGYITDLTFDGLGCPEGTTLPLVTPDGTTFSLFLAEFEIATAINPIPTEESEPSPLLKSISCTVSFTIHVPENKALRSINFAYRGEAAPTGCWFPNDCSNPQEHLPYTLLTRIYSITRTHQRFGFTHAFLQDEYFVDTRDTLDLRDLPSDCGGEITMTVLVSAEVSGRNGYMFVNDIESYIDPTSGFVPCGS